MEISSVQHQVMSSYPLNEVLPVLGYPKPPPAPPFSDHEMKPPPQPAAHPQEALRCPRCDSGNTKFCYYNNYSLTQPRYFCKSCRRYWTKGGTLRNVPVGGGCRKNKRSSFSSPSSSPSPVSASSKKLTQPQHNFSHDPSDFSLSFSVQNDAFLLGNPAAAAGLGFLDILRSGSPAAGGLQGTLHYFGGGNGVMLPFSNSGGVSVSNSTAIMAAETSNAGADSTGRHGGYWNGFVNGGFTHEIHDGF